MMKTAKLPVPWMFALVPFATVFTTVVFALIRATGGGAALGRTVNLRALSYFLYGSGAFIAFLALWKLLVRRGLSLADIGFVRRISAKEALYAVAAFILAFMLYLPVQRLMEAVGLTMFWSGKATSGGLGAPIDIALLFIGAVVLGVIGEDFIYRGYLLSMFRERLAAPWAVTAAVLVFAVVHLPIGPGVTVYMLPWGLISCLIFLKFRSLAPCILFHALNNLVAYLVLPALHGR